MLKRKLNRHLIAFLVIALASILLYPLAQARLYIYMDVLLVLITLAAILTLTTK